MAKVKMKSSKTSLSLIISSLLLGSVSVLADDINITQANKAGISFTGENIVNDKNITSNLKVNLGDYVKGISATNDDDDGDIVDNKTIENQGDINLKISTTQTGTKDYEDDAIAALGISLNKVINNSKILNKGNISTDVTANTLAYANGIEVVLHESKLTDSTITNEGTIVAVAKANKAGSIGILSEDYTARSTIINSGNITAKASGKDANAEAIDLETVEYLTMTNNGTIHAEVTSNNLIDSAGIRIGSITNSTITNGANGVISSYGYGSASDTTVVALNPGEKASATNIQNDGKIEAKLNDMLDNKALSFMIDDAKNITLVNSGKMYGNISLGANSSYNTKFNNKGLIVLPHNANKNASIFIKYEEDKPLKKVSLQPNFADFRNSGTIIVGAKKSSNGIENTQIKAKNATFEAGSKFGVYIAPNSLAFNSGDRLSEVFKVDGTLNGVENITTIKGDLSNISEDRIKSELEAIKSTYKLSALLDVKVEKVGENQIDLIVTTNSVAGTIIENTNSGNVSKITLEVAEIFDTIRANPSKYPALSTVLAQVDNVQYAKDVVSALNSFTPTTALAVSNIANSVTSSISNVVSTRLASLQNSSGLNSGDDMLVDNNRLWIKTYGSLGKQQNKDSINGFDLKTYGLALGYDKEYKDGQIIGLATSYTNGKLDVNGLSHKTDVDAYTFVAYGSNLLKDDKTTVSYQASHTWQKNDSKRAVFTGDTANAKFTAKTFALDVKLAHKMAINDKLVLEPNVGLSYTRVSNPSFTESGAGALNLKTEKFSSTETLAKVGTNFAYSLNSNSTLNANVGVGYDLKGDKTSIKSSFAGTDLSFDSKGIDNGRWQYQAGVGYDYSLNKNSNVNLSYNYQGKGSKFTNNVVALDYVYKF